MVAVMAIATLLSAAADPRPASAAAPSFVQMQAREIRVGKTNSVSFTNANTAGNLIVVSVFWSNTGAVTLTDSRGNTYASAAVRRSWGSNWSEQIVLRQERGRRRQQGDGVVRHDDQELGHRLHPRVRRRRQGRSARRHGRSVGTAAAMSSGPLTTTAAGDLLFAAGASTNVVTAAGSGWTTRSTASGDRTQDQPAAAPGTYSATATQNGTSWVMQAVAFRPDTSSSDTTAPTVPTGLTANGSSTTQVDLSWIASSDNVGVTGYRVFRNGSPVATPATTAYQDTGLTPGTTYTYTVSAFDAAGNESAQSASASATTQSPPADTTPPTVSLTAPTAGCDRDGHRHGDGQRH